jgi:hypothetical protein
MSLCLDCQRHPKNLCSEHHATNNLSDGSELREGELEILARSLFLIVEGHKPVGCHACMGSLLQAEKRLKELGVVPQ